MFNNVVVAWSNEKVDAGSLLMEWCEESWDEIPEISVDETKKMSLRKAPLDVIEGWIENTMSDDIIGNESEEEMAKFPDKVKAEAQRFLGGEESKFAPEMVYRYELRFETESDDLTPDFLFDNLGICILEEFATNDADVPMSV